MDGVRMDKWLWAARFFKTRSLASEACDRGRVTSNGTTAKPSRDVRIGDRLLVRNESGEFEVVVLQLTLLRGPAAAAQGLYQETEASRTRRAQAAEERKLTPYFDAPRDSKPSKRNRRDLERFRGRY